MAVSGEACLGKYYGAPSVDRPGVFRFDVAMGLLLETEATHTRLGVSCAWCKCRDGLQSSTTEAAVVEKPAKAEEHDHHGHAH